MWSAAIIAANNSNRNKGSAPRGCIRNKGGEDVSLLLESKWALLKMEEGIIRIGNSSSSTLRATEHSTLSPPYRPLEPHSRHCCASFMSSKATLTGVLSFPSLIPPLLRLNATLPLQNAPQSSPCSSPLPSELAFLHHDIYLCSSHSRPLEGRECTFSPSDYPSLQHIVGPEWLLVKQSPGIILLKTLPQITGDWNITLHMYAVSICILLTRMGIP